MDWRAAGELAVWVVAIAAALGVIVRSLRSRPVRWLWRRNVAEPIGEWNDRRTRTIVAEVVSEQFAARSWTNGESWEAIDKIRQDVAELRGLIEGAPVHIEQTVKRTTRIEPDT